MFKESQPHLLQCPPIVQKMRNLVDIKNVEYNMIFGSVQNQVKLAKIYSLIMRTRLDLMEEMRNS